MFQQYPVRFDTKKADELDVYCKMEKMDPLYLRSENRSFMQKPKIAMKLRLLLRRWRLRDAADFTKSLSQIPNEAEPEGDTARNDKVFSEFDLQ